MYVFLGMHPFGRSALRRVKSIQKKNMWESCCSVLVFCRLSPAHDGRMRGASCRRSDVGASLCVWCAEKVKHELGNDEVVIAEVVVNSLRWHTSILVYIDVLVLRNQHVSWNKVSVARA